MKKTFLRIFWLAVLFGVTELHAQNTCAITATLRNQNYQPQAGMRLTVSRVTLYGVLISLGPVTYTSDALGLPRSAVGDSIRLPRGAVACIETNVAGFNVPGGFCVTIPSAPVAALESLQPAGATPSTNAGFVAIMESDRVPTIYVTGNNDTLIVSNGTLTALSSTRVQLTTGGGGGGGSITLREVDGIPSIASATIFEVDQADGLVMTNPSGTTGRLDLAAVPLARLATGSESQMILGDASGVWTARSISGDVTITSGGITTVSDDSHAHTTTTVSGLDAGADFSAGFLPLARGGLNADLSATGGTSQVLKQISAGAAITVGQLAFSDLSGTATDAQVPNTITLDNLTQITTRSHASLQNLTNSDDHTQYLLSGGRSGSQTAIGGTGAGEFLFLQSTANASRGQVVALDQFHIRGASPVELEGATVDDNEFTIAVTDPTTDRIGTLPNASGEFSLLGQDIALGSEVSGVLPVANGGTNSSAALNNGRVVISSGGAIVERAALTASALTVGDATNGVASLALGSANRVVGMNSGATANEYKDVLGTSNRVTVTHAANSITLNAPQDLHTAALNQFGRTILDSLRFTGVNRISANNDTLYFHRKSDGLFQFKLFLGDVPATDEVLKMSAGRIASWQADAVSGGAGGYATIQEEGSGLTQRGTLNFIGSGLTAADNSGSSRTDVTVDSDLNALASNSTDGLWAHTGSGTGAARTLTGTGGAVSITNGDGVSGNPTFTLPSAITVPTSYAIGSDPADAGVIRLENAAIIGWEASPAGTDVTLAVDASEIMQASGTFNAVTLTENSNGITNNADALGGDLSGNLPNPSVTDDSHAHTTSTISGLDLANDLNTFSSSNLSGRLTDETGSGAAMFGTSPSITTDITIPNTGLHLLDTDASHDLIVAPGSNITADRTLTITIGDADRTLTINASTTLGGGTNTGDQTITLTNDVTGSGTGSFATTIANDAVTLAKMANIATASVIGRNTASTGDPEVLTTLPNGVQDNITRLGTITVGVWNGTDIAVADGGTGAGTFTSNGVLYGNGTSALQVTSQGGANTVLTANAGAPSFSGQPTLATGIITKGQNAVEIDPYGVSAGNTGEARFLELAANGTNYGGWRGHDAYASSVVYRVPRKEGASTGYVLHYSSTGDSTYWDTDDGAGGGAPTDAQYLTLALNGSLSAERVVVGATNNISLNDAGANGNLTIGLASTLDFAAKVVINDTILVAEGATANGFETHFTIDDPTADREINWPDADGEVTVLGNSSTGTGGVVREGSPTITTPTIADLTNMNHIHQGVTSGGYFVGNSFIRAQNNTDAASNQVAQFQSGDRATAADDDEGYLSFYNDNDGGTQTEFSRFSWLATDVTAATKDAAFTFDIMSANSLTEVLRIQSSAAGTITVNVLNGTLQQGGTAVTLQDRTITVAGTTNEITSSAGAQNLSANRTWTLSLPATIDLGGKTSFEIPNAAAPTTDAFGEIAGDDNAYATGRGAAQFYDGTTSTWLIGFPTTETKTDGYIPKYIAATGRWRLAPDSTTAGGGTAWDAIADAAGLGSISFAGFDQDITSAEDGGDILTITNSDADRASDSNILVLADNDGGDANAFYLRMIGDADGTPTNDYLFSQTSFSVGAGIAATFASASSLTLPTSGGAAPTADGSVAYDNTTDRYKVGGAGTITGTVPRVLAVGHPAESLTNSTASDQDYTSIFTIPASYLIENRVIRVTLGFEYVTGTSTVTIINYLKLGSTKVFTNTAADLPNTATRSGTFSFVIYGTAAAGASVNVETMIESGVSLNLNNAAQANALNNTDQPVALATNGSLNIVPGVTYSGTGSTETFVLRTFIIEELN